MALIVQKYGGTSVADPDRIRAVAENIAFTRRHGNDVVAVVSAIGKATDNLIALAHQVSSTLPGREYDMLVTTGERVSMALVCMALADLGVDAVSFTGSQVGIITDTVHTKAKILEVKGDRVRSAVAVGKVCVVAGFQGVSTAKEITSLGRGGSDTTAVALAAALQAQSCEIYTDVTGMFSADPRIVPQAQATARQLRRDARDGRRRQQGAGVAQRGVRPQPQRSPPRAIELHLGARHVGHRSGAEHGRARHLRRRHRRQRVEGHDRQRAGPARHLGDLSKPPVRT